MLELLCTQRVRAQEFDVLHTPTREDTAIGEYGGLCVR